MVRQARPAAVRDAPYDPTRAATVRILGRGETAPVRMARKRFGCDSHIATAVSHARREAVSAVSS